MIRALIIAVLLALSPMAASAQDGTVRDRMIEVLREDGYREIRISSTLLGRLRFVATKPEMRREIVVNPNTGVILRDYIRFSRADDDDGPAFSSGGGENPFEDGDAFGGGGSSNDDDDDDDDDDYDDDRDDDDGDDGSDDGSSGSDDGDDGDDD